MNNERPSCDIFNQCIKVSDQATPRPCRECREAMSELSEIRKFCSRDVEGGYKGVDRGPAGLFTLIYTKSNPTKEDLVIMGMNNGRLYIAKVYDVEKDMLENPDSPINTTESALKFHGYQPRILVPQRVLSKNETHTG